MSIHQITPDYADEKDPESIWNKNPDEGKTPEEIREIEEKTCLRGKRYETFLEAMRYYENLYPNIDPLLLIPAVMWEFGWDNPDTKNKDLEEYGRTERNIIFKNYGICRTYNKDGEGTHIADSGSESGDSTLAESGYSLTNTDDSGENSPASREGSTGDELSDKGRPEGSSGEVGTD